MSRGGKHPKQLGSALEARVVKRAKAKGLEAARQPYSGATPNFPNDVTLDTPLGVFLAECKVRSVHPSMTDMLAWLYGAQENAKRKKMAGALVIYNTKGSASPKVLIDLDLFLSVLAARTQI